MAKYKMHLAGMSLMREYRKTTKVRNSASSGLSDGPRLDAQVNDKLIKLTSDLSLFELEVLHLNPRDQVIKDCDDQEPHQGSSKSEITPSCQRLASMSTQWNFCNLPTVVLCLIFSFLNLKDLCQVSQVCRQWYSAARNPRLWKLIQKTPSDPDQLMMFLKRYVGKSLVFLRPFLLSTTALQHIKQNCSNIQALWLIDIDLKSLDFTYIPSSLISLALVPKLGTHYAGGEWWKLLKKFISLDFLFISRTDSPDKVMQLVSQLNTLTGLRFEECNGEISEETFAGLTNKLADLTFLSLTGCSGVRIQYLEHIGRNLKCLQQLRLNHAWTLRAERDLHCLTSLPELKVLHIQNGTDADTVQVQEFSDCFQNTVVIFYKTLEMLVLTDLGWHEAVLNWRSAQGLQRAQDFNQRQKCTHTQLEQVQGGGSFWVRVLFMCNILE